MPSRDTLSDAANDLLREIRDNGKNTVVNQRGRALVKLRAFGFVEDEKMKITSDGRAHLRTLKRKAA